MFRHDFTRPARRIAVAVVCLSLLVPGLAGAQEGEPPLGLDSEALWLVKGPNLLKVDTGDRQIELEIPAERVRALAVDPRRRHVWVHAGGRLTAYDFTGAPVAGFEIGSDRKRRPGFGGGFGFRVLPFPGLGLGHPEDSRLAVEPASGDVFLAQGNTVRRLARDGTERFRAVLSQRVVDIALDPERQVLWAVTRHGRVRAIGPGGAVSEPLAPMRRHGAEAVAFDASHDAFWLATRRSLLRVGPDGSRQVSAPVGHLTAVDADGQGGVWAIGRFRLVHVTAAGRLDVEVYPGLRARLFGSLDQLSANPADASVWIGNRFRAAHFAADGSLIAARQRERGRGFPEFLRELELYADVRPAELSFLKPDPDEWLSDKRPELRVRHSRDADLDSLAVTARGDDLGVACQTLEPGDPDPRPLTEDSDCTPQRDLPEGMVPLEATVEDFAGNESDPAEHQVKIDTIPPEITIDTPQNGLITNEPDQTLSGELSEPADLSVNGDTVALDSEQRFSRSLTLTEGKNSFALSAVDRAGNTTDRTITVTLDTVPPPAVSAGEVTVEFDGEQAVVTGGPGSTEGGAEVEITNTRTGETVRVQAAEDGSFRARIDAEAGDTLRVTAVDAAGNRSEETEIEAGGGAIPPDPEEVASPLSETGITPFDEATAFLYTGSNPIQTGVEPGTIEDRRAAVIRGRVTTRAGEPLSGVEVSILDHPELGQTRTREDGEFDLAVNGGGQLTLVYEKDGFLSAQRTIETPWNDYTMAPDVALVQLSDKATTINLASGEPMQVAQGPIESDADGERQATLMFPEGTAATITTPEGEKKQLTELTIRATEYTVGENGPEAMPAELPPSSGYTYAVELSADEARAQGVKIEGKDVVFNQPIPFYVDNFLAFPTGSAVPTGFYNNDDVAWEAVDNGRVIEILSESSGQAIIDLTGDGEPATEAELAELNINDAELARLAELQEPGDQLWRTPIEHLSTWDCNWPFGPPLGASGPPVGMPGTPDKDRSGDTDDEDECEGCVISPQGQTVGEEIPVTGTPFTLNYRSDRVRGRRTESSVTVPVTDDSVPDSLESIEVTAEVAGRRLTRRPEPAAELTETIKWDGRDAYGRRVFGTETATVTVTYFYPCIYRPGDNGFSRFSSSVDAIGTRDDCSGFTFSQRSKVQLESPFEPPVNVVGNWSLSNHHALGAQGGRLLRGDGEQRVVSATIDTVAGNGDLFFPGDGSRATEAGIRRPAGVAVGPDGSLYIADSVNAFVFRVTPDGFIETVAGTGVNGFSGDGGLATEAKLRDPIGVAIRSDGTVFIADSGNHRIRRVTPNGIIETVAGTGESGFSGDGGPATEAQLSTPTDVAVGPAGSLYIADVFDIVNSRIRRVAPDGTIETLAGTDNGPAIPVDGRSRASEIEMDARDIAVGPDGSVYLTNSLPSVVARVTPDGFIQTVAGTDEVGRSSGDGGPATEAALDDPRGVAIRSDGTLFIAESGSNANRVRRVSSNGIIDTVAGTGERGFSGDGGPATEARLERPHSLAIRPNGALYIADLGNRRVRRVQAVGAVRSSSDGQRVASRDGTRVFVFDRSGRHLRTEDARTGETLLEFSRDSEGRLTAITDGDGNTTKVERDANGRSTAIVSPDGQRTELTVNDKGHLTEVANPAGENFQMAYTDDGLMTRFTDRRGLTNEFAYDELGRLIEDINAGGGGWTLERKELEDGYKTLMTSAEGHELTFTVEPQSTGERIQRNIRADGTVQKTRIGPGGETATFPDGTVRKVEEEPDPRFSMDSPVAERTTTTVPSGLERVVTRSRAAELPAPEQLTQPEKLTRTVSINGRMTETAYDGSSRTFTTTTPEGRNSTTEIDGQGRPLRSQVGSLALTERQYDARGRLTEITRSSSAQTRNTRLAYHDSGAQAGFLASITDPLGRQVQFSYDAAGRVTEQRLPDGRTVGFQYDGNGNLTAITPPGRTAHVFEYNDLDERSVYQPPDLSGVETVTRFTYNRDRQLTKIERPGGETVAFTYDSGGRLSQQSASVGSWQFGYEADTGRLASIDAPGGVGLAFTWDGFLPKSTTWSGPVSGTVSRTFDDNFFVTERAVNGNGVAFSYDDDGLLTSAGALTVDRGSDAGLVKGTTLSDVTGSRSYNPFAELVKRTVDNAGTTVYEVSHERDELGRIVEETETVGGETHTFRYSYDEAGRLTEVRRDGSVWHSYSYDQNGNRLEHVGPQGTETGSYDAQDRLTSYDGQSYEYTPAGELQSKTTSAGTTTYDYDALGNLRQVSLPDGRTIEYVIDGRDRRVGKKVDGELVQGFLYKDQLNPIAELDKSGNVEARFVYADKPNVPAYMIKDGTTYRIVSDHLGSVRLVINTSTREVAQRMDYSPYGRVITDTNPGFQPFGFAGGVYDPDTGLVRFGARDYDPEVGRWTAKDPIRFAGGSTNLYGYVLNDPINLVDSNGLIAPPALENRQGPIEGNRPSALPQGFVNFVAGFGGPIATTGRDLLGVSGGVNECSSAFRAGQVSGGLLTAAGGLTAIARGAPRVAGAFTALGISQKSFKVANERSPEALAELGATAVKARVVSEAAKVSSRSAVAVDLAGTTVQQTQQ